ncbi:PTS ascorbate-specific transporter subunit IIA [Actinobacillus delphinicola]|uniref:PTS sugar transporter subunit IIA n=1 Tax=Actinobacillus delphinicola TaxID=51161 RepID=UPI0024420F24|nr:PTS sugar transporter subunit IIA [Actinobacillus delphinicola]MDG6897751.1 PTS ascorbate-specific transporter subunit IIA [Actinobacillus delphinicola]
MLKKSLIENNAIKLNQQADNWQDAIKIAVDMLISAGCAEERYLENIVKGIKEHGPYIILAPGLAMPHARPEDGVIKSGFSLVTFKHPVYFEGEDSPVYMMIALAGSDANAHMEGLVEITQVLDDPESETGVNIDKFRQCQTEQDVLRVLDTALV